MTRDLALIGVEILEHGAPAFTFLCDCAAQTRVLIDGLAAPGPATFEFAFTCDGCGSAQWLTIARPALTTPDYGLPNDIDATGHCCCNGCIGEGPCDLDPIRLDEGETNDD